MNAQAGARRARLLGLTAGEQLSAVALAFVVAGVVLAVSGYNPWHVYQTLVGSLATDPWSTIRWATPLILTGLATAVAFRARVWNIGMDGQLFIGALFGAVVALELAPRLDPNLGVGVVLVAASVGGAAWALVPAVLRVLWGVPEIITTILFIEIARLLVAYLVLGPLKGSGSFGSALSTDAIDKSLWLLPLTPRQPATVGIYVSVIIAVLIAIYLHRSRHGYEIGVFGDNRKFAFYVGMRNPWILVRTMLLSGGLAGLAGGLEVLGSMHRLPSEFVANLGFQGIAVSLVANNNPLGVIVSGLFFGGLKTGGTNLQRLTDTPRDVVDILTAIVILVVTARIGYAFFARRRAALAQASSQPSSGGSGA